MDSLIPSPEPSAEDIRAIWARAAEALQGWERVRTSEDPAEYDAYRAELATALSGLSHVEQFIESKLTEWKTRKGAVHIRVKELQRYEDLAKSIGYRLKRQLPS